MTKLALIGRGRWGKVLEKEFGQKAEILHTCTQTLGNTRAALSDPAVKAVIIATPTEAHHEIALLALEQGKHVFLEKPGTTSSHELAHLMKVAEAKKLTFVVGYELPHHPAAQKLKELIGEREILEIRFDWKKWGSFRYDAVQDLFCHEVSIMLFLGLGHLMPLSSRKMRVLTGSDIVETSLISELTRITSVINRVSPSRSKSVTVVLRDVSYVWEDDKLFVLRGGAETAEEIPLPETTSVGEEAGNFLSAIESGGEPLINGAFALKVYEVVEKVQHLSKN